MKKLTATYKKWLLHRARRQSTMRRARSRRGSQVHIVKAWYGGEVENVIAKKAPVKPPKKLCLDTNADESLSFLDGWRARFSSIDPNSPPEKSAWFLNSRSPNGMRRVGNYVDFSEIDEISTSVALVLTAEYDRVGTLLNKVPPTININDWKPAVFNRLFEIGFFQVLKLTTAAADFYKTDGHVRSMQILTGSNASELEAA